MNLPAGSSQINLRSTATGGIGWLLMSTANSSSLGGGKFSIYGNSQHRFVVDQNGNVGIGTTSPTSKLHVSNGCLTLDGTSPNWNTWKARITAPMGSAWVTNEPVNFWR